VKGNKVDGKINEDLLGHAGLFSVLGPTSNQMRETNSEENGSRIFDLNYTSDNRNIVGDVAQTYASGMLFCSSCHKKYNGENGI
jgi:hypothetical protein